MIQMQFTVKALLETLQKNREAHAKNFEQMKKDYREAFTEILKDKLAVLQDPKQQPPSRDINLQKPFHYLDSYDDVIEMLKATNDETITLNNDQFKCYYRDKWPQKQTFDSVGSSYSGFRKG